METFPPDRIPVICIPATPKQQDLLGVASQSKFLVRKHITAPVLTMILRRKLASASNQSIFMLIGGRMVPSHATFEELHSKHKAADGILYVTYSAENVMG